MNAEASSDSTARSSIRVVVVDDCPDVRFLLGTILELDGRFEIVGEAHDAVAGMNLVASIQPDLALVDLGLGGLDGVWLIEELRRRNSDVALAVVTGSEVEQDHAAAREAGADSVHTKASLTSTLTAELTATVARRQATRDGTTDDPSRMDRAATPRRAPLGVPVLVRLRSMTPVVAASPSLTTVPTSV